MCAECCSIKLAALLHHYIQLRHHTAHPVLYGKACTFGYIRVAEHYVLHLGRSYFQSADIYNIALSSEHVYITLIIDITYIVGIYHTIFEHFLGKLGSIIISLHDHAAGDGYETLVLLGRLYGIAVIIHYKNIRILVGLTYAADKTAVLRIIIHRNTAGLGRPVRKIKPCVGKYLAQLILIGLGECRRTGMDMMQLVRILGEILGRQ